MATWIPIGAASPVFPDWGFMERPWADNIPAEGWREVAPPSPGTAAEGFAAKGGGIEAIEMKYLRYRSRDPEVDPKRGMSRRAAPGEYASFAFMLRSSEAMEASEFQVLPFRDGKGSERGAPLSDVRVVRQLVKRIKGTKTYSRYPTLLDKAGRLEIGKGGGERVWITAYVPEDCPPGEYASALILRSGATRRWSMPIRISVLPIRLQAPGRIFQLYYSLSSADPIHPETVRKEFRDMKEHGFNSVALLATPELAWRKDSAEIDFGRSIAGEALGMDSLVSVYKAEGFRLPINYSFALTQLWHFPEGGWRKAAKNRVTFKASVKKLLEESRRKIVSDGWPILNFGLDEPAPRLDEAAEFLGWIGEDYPFPSLVNCHGAIQGIDDVARLEPLAGIISVTRTVPGIARSVAEVRGSGKRLWLCNGGGFGADPALDRYFFGFDAWRLGADGVSQWNYHQGAYEFWTQDQPYGAVKGDYPMIAYGYPSARGPIPTISWEAVREGIDDARYLHTLEGMLGGPDDAGKGLPGRAAAKSSAKRYLDSLKASLPVENAEREAYLRDRSEDFLDRFRDDVINHILAVRNGGT